MIMHVFTLWWWLNFSILKQRVIKKNTTVEWNNNKKCVEKKLWPWLVEILMCKLYANVLHMEIWKKKSSWARENYICVFYIYWVECSVRWRCTLYTYINVIRVASSSYFKCTLFFQKYDKKYFLIILHWNNYKVSPLCKSDIEDFVGQKVDDSHI